MAAQTVRRVSVYDAKTHFSQLASEVARDDIEILVTRHEKPLIRLVPALTEQPPRTPGALKGHIVASDDWDEFTDDDARDWYGGDVDWDQLTAAGGASK
jgi:prevent-host-death family protein